VTTRRRLSRVWALAAAVCLPLVASGEPAHAGEYQVANCQADQLNFSTRAFDDFATRGMSVTRACNPEGPGSRGLITANVARGGRVPRGARALVSLSAPFGTRFTSFRWAGDALRRDCGFALQLYAEGPGIAPIAIKNVRANQGCPRPGRAQSAGYRSRAYNVSGATRIVQRVICVGSGRPRSCSARGANFIRTYKATVTVADVLPPSLGISQDTPLSRGEWVSGTQPLNYDASDNVGVRSAAALVAGTRVGLQDRPCVVADAAGNYADPVPCANGPGQITVDTKRLVEGTQQLLVQAEDTAGNVGSSAPVTVRVDNTPPGRVDVGVQGGEGWRNTNDFALAWSNPPEGDRAPITAANYKVCSLRTGTCERSDRGGPDVSSLTIAVPAPGEWRFQMWRRDAAGNQDEGYASTPVTLRYDPEPPKLGFEQSPASDPTLVSVLVTDDVSGLADGSIEISRAGSGIWQTLATQKDGSRLIARIDDAALEPGQYLLRAFAFDQARNEGSTDRRLDGQPMTVVLPLRVVATIQANIVDEKIVWRAVRRRGRLRRVQRRVTVLRPAASVGFGRRVQVVGRLVNGAGDGIVGAAINVYSATRTSAEQLVGSLQTDGAGRFGYIAEASSSRALRFAYAGSAVILPAQSQVELAVPAASSIRVNRTRLLNGQTVTFSGRLAAGPIPPGGKLVELQVLRAGRWQTFRTTNTDAAGRWTVGYRFTSTTGVQRYRFRARLPREASYPFETGASSALAVQVRGRG
jgi:hypothetical protein